MAAYVLEARGIGGVRRARSRRHAHDDARGTDLPTAYILRREGEAEHLLAELEQIQDAGERRCATLGWRVRRRRADAERRWYISTGSAPAGVRAIARARRPGTRRGDPEASESPISATSVAVGRAGRRQALRRGGGRHQCGARPAGGALQHAPSRAGRPWLQLSVPMERMRPALLPPGGVHAARGAAAVAGMMEFRVRTTPRPGGSPPSSTRWSARSCAASTSTTGTAWVGSRPCPPTGCRSSVSHGVASRVRRRRARHVGDRAGGSPGCCWRRTCSRVTPGSPGPFDPPPLSPPASGTRTPGRGWRSPSRTEPRGDGVVMPRGEDEPGAGSGHVVLGRCAVP